LQSKGFNPGPLDGIFGQKTNTAVKHFQGSKGLVADGIVGPLTWQALLL
jgi:peptidoglycan hydrolase-like protein with peptidoglycan-binding domain